MIHQPCEITVHLLSEDILIHPPAPNSDVPGRDQTLRGVVEIKAPSERTIHGVKVTLQGIQTIGIPDATHPSAGVGGIRWEEKLVMDKSMEVLSDGEGGIIKQHKNKGKGKGKAAAAAAAAAASGSTSPVVDTTASSGASSAAATPDAVTAPREDGIHLSKGVHG